MRWDRMDTLITILTALWEKALVFKEAATLQYDELTRNIDKQAITDTLKRYWHIALPSAALLIVGSYNTMTLMADDSSRVKPDTYSIRLRYRRRE